MLLYFDNDKYFNKKTKRVPCSPACVYIRHKTCPLQSCVCLHQTQNVSLAVLRVFTSDTKRVPCSPACLYIRHKTCPLQSCVCLHQTQNVSLAVLRVFASDTKRVPCSPACVYIRLQINISKNTNKCRSFLITLGISVKDSASMIAF